jgi:hypothetical protein
MKHIGLQHFRGIMRDCLKSYDNLKACNVGIHWVCMSNSHGGNNKRRYKTNLGKKIIHN